jgi:hypothetical protein
VPGTAPAHPHPRRARRRRVVAAALLVPALAAALVAPGGPGRPTTSAAQRCGTAECADPVAVSAWQVLLGTATRARPPGHTLPVIAPLGGAPEAR